VLQQTFISSRCIQQALINQQQPLLIEWKIEVFYPFIGKVAKNVEER
jgi:hypothetical protein